MKVGDLVKRCPDSWEYLYPHELAEVGIVTRFDEGYAVVLWASGLSWDDPEALLVVATTDDKRMQIINQYGII